MTYRTIMLAPASAPVSPVFPRSPVAQASPAAIGPVRCRRIVLVDLIWTRDKDPRVPLGHACLLASLRGDTRIDARSVLVPVNKRWSVTRIADGIFAQAHGCAPDGIDIAIGAYVWNEAILQALLPALRARGFRGRIILGGPQISYVLAGLEQYYPDADLFIRGAAETALRLAVLAGSTAETIPGVHYAGTPDLAGQATVNLASAPSPLLGGLIDLAGQDFLRWESQRGCAFKCTFCQHRQADSRVVKELFPQGRVSEEIALICRAGVKEVAVLDPVFNSDSAHAVSVLRQFSRHGFTGRLALQCRIEQVDDDFLDAAAALDVCLEFGLQTIHGNEQDAIKRRNNMRVVEQVLAKVRARGIDHEVSLIFGLPEQTLASFTESVAWCLARQVPIIKAFPLLLLRGTEMARDRDRWAMVDDGTPMQQAMASNSFSHTEHKSMAAISEALAATEGAHPPLAALLAMAATLRPDRSRFTPPAPGAAA